MNIDRSILQLGVVLLTACGVPEDDALDGTSEALSAPIAFVQIASATPQTPRSSVPVTFANAQLAGHLNVVVIGWSDAAASVTSVSDSRGNAYSRAIGTTRGASLSQTVYYAPGIRSGTNTVTVTFNQAAVYPDVRIVEYAGLDPVRPLDVTSAAAGAGTSASSGAATSTAVGALVFGAGTTTGSFHAAGSGFVSRLITSPDGDLVEDRIATAPGAYSATAPLNYSAAWVMQVVTFRPPPPHGVDLAWSASASPNVVTTNIYRSTAASGPFTHLASVAAATTRYLDAAVSSGTTYYYAVSAVDAASESLLSPPVAAAVP